MKILHLSTSFSAQSAGYRIHKALVKSGIDSRVLVELKSINGSDILGPNTTFEKVVSYLRLYGDQSLLKLYRHKTGWPFSPSFIPERLPSKINTINPSIVHLHWICGGMIKIESLKKIQAPIVWTLHDSWAFTGGCHIPINCTLYQNRCGKCPTLGSNSNIDMSRWIWKRKFKSWRDIQFILVSPSTWLANCAHESSLFQNKRIEIIPNGVDTTMFKPLDKKIARNILNLPENKIIIVFGANSIDDPNKGSNFFLKALTELIKYVEPQEVEIVFFGNSTKFDKAIPFKCHYLGAIHDEIVLPIIYSSADLVAVPSISENFPNTILESLSCGTPVVAFEIGGIPDQIIHKYNGYLAKPYLSNDLAEGINWIIDNRSSINLQRNCRNIITEKFDISMTANKYIKLYEKLEN
jgi:glycosyltransferase involved in cell wall biosynthesis